MAIEYFPTRFPDPGTGNYAFDAGMTLPIFQVQAMGIIPRSSFNVRQFGMAINQATVVQSDLTNGGFIQGQFIGQPLSPPASN